MENNQIVIYQTPDGETSIDVFLDHETVWLDQEKISDLFQTDRSSITKHLKNIYKSTELSEEATCAKVAQVQTESKPDEKDIIVQVVVNLINGYN